MNEKNIPLHATIEIIPNIRVHCLPDQDQTDIFGPWIPWRLCGFIAIKATWLWTDGSTKEKLCLYGTHLIIFCPQPFPWDVGSCLKEDLSPVQHWWKKMLTSHLKHKQEGWSPLRLYLRPPPSPPEWSSLGRNHSSGAINVEILWRGPLSSYFLWVSPSPETLSSVDVLCQEAT